MEFLKRLAHEQSPSSYEFLKRLVRKQLPNLSEPMNNPAPINDYYLTTAPSPQSTLDIFKGEWASQLPPPLNNLQAGKNLLFDDIRIKWLLAELGNLHGQHILELGPLEGGHSYMLEKGGAESVTAIDANTHAYIKCLIAKELLGMQRVRFLCGDFIEYMKSPDCQQFDIGVASGVLYHMVNPAELIFLLAKCCKSDLLIWTHYYDDDWAKTKGLQNAFPFTHQVDYEGFSHKLVQHYYGDEVIAKEGFCGGSRPYSSWMYRDEIIKCLNYFGFAKVQINFDDYNHPNGPAFTLLASRTGETL